MTKWALQKEQLAGESTMTNKMRSALTFWIVGAGACVEVFL